MNLFSNMVEKTVKEKKISYIEAILELSEKNNVDLEDVPKLININIKQSIEVEGENLNLLKKSNRLMN